MDKFIQNASKGNVSIIKLILEKHYPSNEILSKAFIHASYGGYLEIINLLWSFSINNSPKYDLKLIIDDALCGACFSNHKPIIKYLIELGAKPDCNDNLCFIFACQGGYIDLAQYLISLGVNPKQQIDICRKVATTFNQTLILNYLLNF